MKKASIRSIYVLMGYQDQRSPRFENYSGETA